MICKSHVGATTSSQGFEKCKVYAPSRSCDEMDAKDNIFLVPSKYEGTRAMS